MGSASPLPLALPNIVKAPDGSFGPSLSGFPLSANATIQELATFVDALALKVYPKGYWQLTWALNTVNLVTFFTVTLALRAYRSRNNSVPFWLFKLEQRSYPVHQVHRVKRRLKAFENLVSSTARASTPSCNLEGKCFENNHSGTGEMVGKKSEARMGWFITASCVNCHLILTSAYVILLFIQTIQSYVIRSSNTSPALLEPGVLDCIKMLFIFSTAFFAALGYIALLLPFVPPWLWNCSVFCLYASATTIGLASGCKAALSASKLNAYRTYMYKAIPYISRLDAATGDGFSAVDPATPTTWRMVLFAIAIQAYAESLDQRKWQIIYVGLIAVGGFTLGVVYLCILVLLVRVVAKELVQLRSSPSSLSTKQADGLVRPDTAVLASTAPHSPLPGPATQVLEVAFGASPPRKDRFSFQTRSAPRSPPSTPAPSGPLPSPPAEAAGTLLRSSPSQDVAYAERVLHGRISPTPSSIHSYSHSTEVGIASAHEKASLQDRANSSIRSPAQCNKEFMREQHHSVQIETHYERAVSPTESETAVQLELRPRLAVDPEFASWDLTTLHADMATHDGYVAVCRFLFNCIVDHAAVMLQCFAFACHSAYMAVLFSKDYPGNAHKTSSAVGVTTMAAASLFTVLYVLNCLNLFAPFLLFPASQVKLASMLASLSLNTSRLDRRNDDAVSWSRPQRRARKVASKEAHSHSHSHDHRSSHGRLNALRLQPKDSRTSLITSVNKQSSETYTSASQGVHPYSARWDPAGYSAGTSVMPGSLACSEAHSSCDAQYPPSVSKDGSNSYSQMSACDSSSETAAEASAGVGGDGSGSGIGARVAASVKSMGKLGVASGGTDARTWKRCNQFSTPAQHFALQSDTHTSRNESATHGSAWTAKCVSRVFSRFSTHSHTQRRAHVANDDMRAGSLWTRDRSQAGSLAPSSTTAYAPSTESSSALRPMPKASQLVLDSLISSRALPIGGFYCHANCVADSATALRMQRCNEPAESARTFTDAYALAERLETRSDERDRLPTQSMRHEHCEAEERLRADQAAGDCARSYAEPVGWRRPSHVRTQLQRPSQSTMACGVSTRPDRSSTHEPVLDESARPSHSDRMRASSPFGAQPSTTHSHSRSRDTLACTHIHPHPTPLASFAPNSTPRSARHSNMPIDHKHSASIDNLDTASVRSQTLGG